MTLRPVVRNSFGLAVAEVQALRDAVELAVGQEIAFLCTNGRLDRMCEEEYWHRHDTAVERLMPNDEVEVAFLLGCEAPQTAGETERQNLALYEHLSFSHDQVRARFGGENLVVVSVSPESGLALRKLLKLTPEGSP